ncbi:MAG: MerR family transcriptional regulator [Nitrospirota bacterium]|jgi:DNA-binding transcriptional MerR regulator
MQKAPAKKLGDAGASYPDKLFYKIGEVSKIAGVEPYVLRYWESEFPLLRPRKSKSGQRIYVKKDLELVLRIRDMLYRDRYTIEGVRKRLSEGGAPRGGEAAPKAVHSPEDALQHVKNRLRDILKQLS